MLRDYLLADKLSPIFTEILKERINQNKKLGEQNYPMRGINIYSLPYFQNIPIFQNFTFPEDSTLKATLENLRLRNKTDKRGWFDILFEEICEAFLETKPENQREEMIQATAVAVAIIEYLDRKIEGGI
jgi:hypothetical protein